MIYIPFKSCINEAHRQKRSSYSVREFLDLLAAMFRGRGQTDPDSFTLVLLAMFNICQSGKFEKFRLLLPIRALPFFILSGTF